MNKKKKIAIIGLGYVGLPLAIEFGKFYEVVGYDINNERIKSLKLYKDTNNDISKSEFKKSKKLIFTNKKTHIQSCNFYIVTVPTPVTKNNKPDLKLIKKACNLVGEFIQKNNIVIFESTVFPGLTNNIAIPIIEKKSKLKLNKDFYCGYSPERINPGDKKRKLKNITKIVSGSNKYSLNLITRLYSTIIKSGVYKVSSIEIAEATKVIENCQRDINVGFMNELSVIFNKLNLDTNEIIKAASTKWNFLNFKPGLVGGHCIGIDPYYLTYISNKVGYNPEIILSGRKVNDNMGNEITKRIISILKINKTSIKKTKFLILGFSFKENCNDTRNTKVYDIYKNLKRKGGKIDIFDPLVDFETVKKEYNINILKKPKNHYYDFIIIAVSHNIFINKGLKNIKLYGNSKALIFDIKNIFPGKKLLYL